MAAAPGGYLDNAIPKTMFRLRYDAGFGLNRPDRSEFFYAAWQELSFHPHGINGNGAFFDPKARGPEQLPASVNYQEVSAYFEVAYQNRFSVFADIPVRFVNFRHLQEDMPESETKRNPLDAPNPGSRFFPEPRDENTETLDNSPGGLSDIQVGGKVALLADPNQYLTAQLRVYIPSGDSRKGLGTGHTSVEPGLLYYLRMNRLQFQAQFRDWIPIGGAKSTFDGDKDFDGNILIYGVGLGYDIYQRGCFRITPITEVVGWTVLSGFETIFGNIAATPPPGFELPLTHGIQSASGDTIVNVKLGVRTYFNDRNDVYVGWGRAVTGDRWYQDILRVEYRFCY